jgi:predicted small secreted protein
MRHAILLVAGILLVAATLAGCDGGGGGQSTVSSGGAPPPTTPSPPGGAGGDGGSGGSGGGSASLNTTRFRALTVSVTPPNGGTVSDNFEDHGSAIQQCTACSERYQLGTRVVLTARAAPGFRFDRWQGSVCTGSVSPTCALVMEQATGMTAVFRR